MTPEEHIETLEFLVKNYQEMCEDYSRLFKRFLFSALTVSVLLNVFLIGKYLF